MTAQELFDYLRAQGATLLERQGTLLVSPAALARAHADQIKANKEELVYLARYKYASTVIASEWPEICCACGKWSGDWRPVRKLYQCPECGLYFKFQPKEKTYV